MFLHLLNLFFQELGSVMKALGQSPKEKEINAMIKEMDTDGNGTVSFEEFTKVMAKKITEKPDENELRLVYKEF